MHELRYELNKQQEELQKATKAHSTFQLLAGGAGLVFLGVAAAGAMVARRGINAERLVAKHLGASVSLPVAVTVEPRP